jgi:predicted TIM-barrel enzyme
MPQITCAFQFTKGAFSRKWLKSLLDSFHLMFEVDKPIIGMVHLLALPGAPRHDSKIGIDGNIEWAMNEARALEDVGVDAIMFCNEFDIPYRKKVGPETVAAMTHIASGVFRLGNL